LFTGGDLMDFVPNDLIFTNIAKASPNTYVSGINPATLTNEGLISDNIDNNIEVEVEESLITDIISQDNISRATSSSVAAASNGIGYVRGHPVELITFIDTTPKKLKHVGLRFKDATHSSSDIFIEGVWTTFGIINDFVFVPKTGGLYGAISPLMAGGVGTITKLPTGSTVLNNVLSVVNGSSYMYNNSKIYTNFISSYPVNIPVKITQYGASGVAFAGSTTPDPNVRSKDTPIEGTFVRYTYKNASLSIFKHNNLSTIWIKDKIGNGETEYYRSTKINPNTKLTWTGLSKNSKNAPVTVYRIFGPVRDVALNYKYIIE
jgi:hypothetical protein